MEGGGRKEREAGEGERKGKVNGSKYEYCAYTGHKPGITIMIMYIVTHQTSDLVVKMKYMRDSKAIHLAGSGRGFVV